MDKSWCVYIEGVSHQRNLTYSVGASVFNCACSLVSLKKIARNPTKLIDLPKVFELNGCKYWFRRSEWSTPPPIFGLLLFVYTPFYNIQPMGVSQIQISIWFRRNSCHTKVVRVCEKDNWTLICIELIRLTLHGPGSRTIFPCSS